MNVFIQVMDIQVMDGQEREEEAVCVVDVRQEALFTGYEPIAINRLRAHSCSQVTSPQHAVGVVDVREQTLPTRWAARLSC